MKDLLYWALTHGDKILFWVMTAVGGLLARAITHYVGSSKAAGIVSRALTEIGDAVLATTQTYVSALKAAAADGKLTDTEKAEAKALAINTAKKLIGPEGLARLAKIVGADLDGWIGTKIEATLGALQPKVTTTTTVAAGSVSKAHSVTVDPQ